MTDIRKAAMQAALEALHIGRDAAAAEAAQFHASMAGYKPARHAAMDADVAQIDTAIEGLRAALAQPEPEPIGEVVIGEDGMTKGWTVVEWRADLPPIAVGTKLYAEPIAQPEQQAEPQVTVLPDGSGFMTASMPLPEDHWLYAPRSEWDNVRDEYAECPPPILTAAHRQAVTTAVRYAIRGATMCGEDADFDPDAMVQNAVYALCGSFGKVAAHPPAQPSQPAELCTLAAKELLGNGLAAVIRNYPEKAEDCRRLLRLLVGKA